MSKEKEFLAQEAARLKDDPIFTASLARIREMAVNALIAADATNITDIVRLQAKISVIDELSGELEQMVLNYTLEKSRINVS